VIEQLRNEEHPEDVVVMSLERGAGVVAVAVWLE